ncbi:trypsin-like peptidase domain-containing protein [Halorhodospira halophila]|uniref:Probable periplasmic serine endoprotease DegP-like n=1 Tax=Halorhodospira halophila (strain DSM 244 / SL1) TaxID=349124 RepID=A1WT20_HALHL|nr:trypsin-like peptidase domain-containing protein [Halorhodospira halophila]ABM60832.1 protease Do [Halorhodospira halophila SL1]MBK1728487.1 serine peptidase [Halorhodospira halophila]
MGTVKRGPARITLTAGLGLGVSAPVGALELPDFTELVRENSAAVVNISTRQEAPGQSAPEEMLPEGIEPQQGPPPASGLRPVSAPLDPLQTPDLEGSRPGPDPFGDDGQSLGSGFLISDDGVILTNHHVVARADEVIVRLSDGREHDADVVGSDERTDLAVVEIDTDDELPTVSVGSAEKLEVGEWVLAIGSPFGFEHSVTAGIVSAKGRSLPHGNYVPYIQTDVAINPGNSGGPLFNLEGDVVGVNSQIYSRTGGFMGLSFAIPIELAIDVAEQLQATGEVERGWLGVLIQDLTRDLAEGFGLERPRGALVSELLDHSPAAEAGIESGDVILEFDGEVVENSATLPPMVGRTSIGRTVELLILRDGEEKTLEVEVAELPGEDELAAPSDAVEGGGGSDLGLQVEPVDDTTRQQLELDDEGGVLITSVEEGPAADAGLQVGDVLVSFDRQPVHSAEDLNDGAAAADPGSTVPVLVIRDGHPSFLALQMP